MPVDDAKLVEELEKVARDAWRSTTPPGEWTAASRAALAFCRARIPALLGMTGDELLKKIYETYQDVVASDSLPTVEADLAHSLRAVGILPPPLKTPGEEFAELLKSQITINDHEMKVVAKAFDAKVDEMARGAK